MKKCIMCGKKFDPDDVENYIDSKFGFGTASEISNRVGEVCDSCMMGIYYADHEENDEDTISIYDAAEIWLSSGKDEDQMFGYTKEELEAALH